MLMGWAHGLGTAKSPRRVEQTCLNFGQRVLSICSLARGQLPAIAGWPLLLELQCLQLSLALACGKLCCFELL